MARIPLTAQPRALHLFLVCPTPRGAKGIIWYAVHIKSLHLLKPGDLTWRRHVLRVQGLQAAAASAGLSRRMWANEALPWHVVGVFAESDVAPTCQASGRLAAAEIVHPGDMGWSPAVSRKQGSLSCLCVCHHATPPLSEMGPSQTATWVSTCHHLPTDRQSRTGFHSGFFDDLVCGLGVSAATCLGMT